jgi:dimethylglycine dehydrogenase
MWARAVGQLVGTSCHAGLEHHYLITEDIGTAGRERELVNTTDYAGEIYMRQSSVAV